VRGATSYYVYASTSGSVSKTSYVQRLGTDTSPLIVTSLANGVWYFVVTAVNSYGEGPPSQVASACVGPYLCP